MIVDDKGVVVEVVVSAANFEIIVGDKGVVVIVVAVVVVIVVVSAASFYIIVDDKIVVVVVVEIVAVAASRYRWHVCCLQSKDKHSLLLLCQCDFFLSVTISPV